jgi:hypothetical protein
MKSVLYLGDWSSEQLTALTHGVCRYGKNNLVAIARGVPHKNVIQVASYLRYLELQPRGPGTADDDKESEAEEAVGEESERNTERPGPPDDGLDEDSPDESVDEAEESDDALKPMKRRCTHELISRRVVRKRLRARQPPAAAGPGLEGALTKHVRHFLQRLIPQCYHAAVSRTGDPSVLQVTGKDVEIVLSLSLPLGIDEVDRDSYS